MPACRAGLYTIKPSIGLVPSQGTLHASADHESLGPMAKSAADIAVLLDIMVGSSDGRFAAALTGNWNNIRVGVLDPEAWLTGLPFIKPIAEIDSQLVKYPQSSKGCIPC